MRRLSWRDHHPGTTMAVMILALADGATAMSDMAMLRAVKTLFGPVASVTTLWRTFNRIGPAELRDLTAADCEARVTAYGLEPLRSRVVIDVDATIVTCRSDKQDAAGTWKRTYGFHPLVAMDVERREVLAQMVRPGNAGSNTASDHVEVLATAIAALPETERAGHGSHDHPEAVCCEIVVRADTGGATHWLAKSAWIGTAGSVSATPSMTESAWGSKRPWLSITTPPNERRVCGYPRSRPTASPATGPR